MSDAPPDFAWPEGFTPVSFTIEGELGTVYFAKLTAGERNGVMTAWEAFQAKRGGKGSNPNVGLECWIVAYCLCTEGNVRHFAGNVPAGFKQIQSWPPEVAEAAAKAAMRHNGLDPEGNEQAGE